MNSLCVLATSSVPPGIRGAMNQWFIETLPGMFVGRVSSRVRLAVWESLRESLTFEDGAYAALIEQDDSEQGFRISTIGEHAYEVSEHLGIQLVTVTHHKRPQQAEFDGFEFPDW